MTLTTGVDRPGGTRGPADVRSHHLRTSSERFLGRDRELERIAIGLQDAADGRPNTLLFASTAGLGASRLLAETSRRLGSLGEPFAVVHGLAMPATVGVPYAPVAVALGRLLCAVSDEELAELVGVSGDAIARLLPILAPRLEALDLMPARRRVVSIEWREAQMLEGVLGLLERLGRRQPVAVLLEDLHHADAATRNLVTFLARVSRQQRVMLIATYQPDRVGRSHVLRPTLSVLAGTESVGHVELAPFDRAELGQLMEAIEGNRPSSTSLLLIAERSGGNVLMAEEFLVARRELSGTSLGGSFERLVAARASLRTPECRRVLRLLSLAGMPVSRHDLAAIANEFERRSSGAPPRSPGVQRRGEGPLDGDLAAGLAEALEHAFLVEVSETGAQPAPGMPVPPSGERLYAFRHELIADAIAADLLPASRRRYHSAIAAARPARPAEALGHHLGALELREAVTASLAAAADAEAQYAGADALGHYEQALTLRETAPSDDAPRLWELYRRAGEAAFASGDTARAVAYAEAAAAAIDDPRDRLSLGLVMERLGQYRRSLGDHERSLEAYRRAVELVPRDATLARARVLAALAQVRMLEGTFSEAKRLATETLRIAESVGDDAREELLHARCTLAVAEAWGDNPEPAIAELFRLVDEAKELAGVDALFRVYANLSTILYFVGRQEEAIAVARDGIAEAERVGHATVYGNFLRGNTADTLFVIGRWQECRELCLDALSWSPIGLGYLGPLTTLSTLEVASTAGEYAGRLLGQLLMALETVSDAQFCVPGQQAAAQYALWQEDLADARRASERGWDAVRDTEDWSQMASMAATYLEVEAEIAQESQRRRDFVGLAAARERSLPVLLRAEAVVRGSRVPPEAGSRRQAELWLRTARAYRTRIEGHDDPALWSRLATDWEQFGYRYMACQARWREAQALLERARGRATRTVAREPLAAAAEGALALGARPLLRRIAELSRRAMLNLPREVALALEPHAEPVTRATAHQPHPVVPSIRATHPAAPPVSPSARRFQPQLAPVERQGPSAVVRNFSSPTAPARKDDFGLSPRELEVLALIAEGRTNPEIGRQLYITRKTVAVHVSNILTKLGVSGRVEAAAVAIRLGLAAD